MPISSKNSSKKKIDFSKVLQTHGFKITPLRVKLLETLSLSPLPLSVESLRKKLRTFGDTATIYRALHAFLQKEMIATVTIEAHALYFFSLFEHHHYLICTHCKKMEPISFCVPDMEKKVLRKSKKFKAVTNHRMEFFGTCRKCRS